MSSGRRRQRRFIALTDRLQQHRECILKNIANQLYCDATLATAIAKRCRSCRHRALGWPLIAQLYIHAESQLKETAMVQTRRIKISTVRFRPNDKLLAFLEAL
jgi:hypothetical protein